MKFGQLIECNKRNVFLQKKAENDAERLVPDFFFVFEKSVIWGKKQTVCSLVSIYFDRPEIGIK